MKLVLGRQNPTFSVAAVQLRADITYSKATVSVIIDERGLNKYARDYVNEVDQLTVAFGKGVLTYQNAIDQITQIAVTKLVQDDYSVSDAVSIMVGFARSYADSVSTSDTITSFGVVKGLIDQIASLDALAMSLTKQLADTVVVIDNADANSGDGLEYTDVKPSSDAVGASDLAVSALTKLLTDTVSITEALQQVVTKLLTDTAIAVEQAALELGRPVSDTTTPSDLFDRVFDANLTASDSFLTLDVLASIDVSKLLTDAANAVSSGSLRMTDYVDITYFAEDYVGSTRTFS